MKGCSRSVSGQDRSGNNEKLTSKAVLLKFPYQTYRARSLQGEFLWGESHTDSCRAPPQPDSELCTSNIFIPALPTHPPPDDALMQVYFLWLVLAGWVILWQTPNPVTHFSILLFIHRKAHWKTNILFSLVRYNRQIMLPKIFEIAFNFPKVLKLLTLWDVALYYNTYLFLVHLYKFRPNFFLTTRLIWN